VVEVGNISPTSQKKMTLILSGGRLYLIICSKYGRLESFNRRLLKEYSATDIHLQSNGQIASLFDWLLLGMFNSDGQKMYVCQSCHPLRRFGAF
jgi:hypothetical protein